MTNGAFGRTTNAYSPSPLTVAVGTVVTFVNSDVAPTTRADNGRFATPIMQPGGTANVTMSTAGSVVYHCSIHPGMVGTINVQ